MAKRLSQREQLILVICIMVVAGYVVFLAVIRPLQEKKMDLAQEIEKKEKVYNKNLRIVQNGESLEKDYQAYFDKFKQTKPDEQVMSSMLAEIERVAAEFSLQISDLKPQRGKSGEYYNRFSVSLTIDSSLTDVMHFLYKLQQEPFLYDVHEFRFDKSPQRKANTVKTNLVLSKTLIP